MTTQLIQKIFGRLFLKNIPGITAQKKIQLAKDQ